MNKYKIYVAGVTIEAEGLSDYQALAGTGLFGAMHKVAYYRTLEKEDMWIYRVELNGYNTTAVIKRVST